MFFLPALFQNPQKNFFGLHPGAKVSVYISAVVNPTEFFVQLISRQLLVLDRLTNEMQIYYGDQEVSTLKKMYWYAPKNYSLFRVLVKRSSKVNTLLPSRSTMGNTTGLLSMN